LLDEVASDQKTNMTISTQLPASDPRTHLLCYLVASALASHAFTQTWRVEHVVESARIWQARNRRAMSWLERVMLGQLALRLSREHVAATKAVPHAKVAMLFTDEMKLNYQSPLVNEIWQRCNQALRSSGELTNFSD
jgi:hypothetical protein